MGSGRAASTAAALALGVLLVMSAPSPASHVRPRGATPLTVPLVPAYYPCTAPNRTHGGPLAYPSCNPPQQLGPYTTLGTPDANGAGAKSVGFVRLKATTGDVRITVAISDVRCLPAESATVCNSANSADGPDYSGPMLLDILFRVTDHGSGTGGGEAATMVDLPLASTSVFQIPCQNTTDTTIGGQCGIVTTYDAGVPGAVAAGKRTIWEVGQIIVDQLSGPSGHEHGYTFLKGGLFLP
jgi:hypothetical protein